MLGNMSRGLLGAAATRCAILTQRPGLAAACTALAASVACSEPLVVPDWTIDVPEGIPIHEYGPVPVGERSARIELVEDPENPTSADLDAGPPISTPPATGAKKRAAMA